MPNITADHAITYTNQSQSVTQIIEEPWALNDSFCLCKRTALCIFMLSPDFTCDWQLSCVKRGPWRDL